MKKIMKKSILIIIFIILCTLMSACGSTNMKELDSQAFSRDFSGVESEEELEVHFLDVGQADCTVIRQGDYTMVIDAGTDDMGTKIQNYLQKLGVSKIDILIVTHWDADHCGGADVLVTKFDIGKMYISDFYKDTRVCEDVLKAMSYKNIAGIVPVPLDTDSLGDAGIQFIGPCDRYEDANNSSIALRLTFANNSFIFAGDAEEVAEEDMLKLDVDLTADVYKVSHHGSKTATSKEFLQAISPTQAVISVGEGNSYGMPHAAPLNELRALGVQVFRTDEEGSIICTSDGTHLSWNMAPSESWQTGEAGLNSAKETEPETNIETSNEAGSDMEYSEEANYIINTNTGKFHIPSCTSASEMAEKNKEKTNLTRDELIEQGYSPCGRCKP